MVNDTRRQIFIFELDGEDYSININSVREIIKSEEKQITNIPNVPDFIRGITNVRGQVVPVIDLEEKLSLAHNDNNYIVIVELNGTPAGLLVDDVKEVMRVDDNKVRDAPEILEQEIHREYVKNVVVLEDRMIIILDIKAGLTESEAVAVEQLKDTMDDSQPEEEEDDEVTDKDVKEAAMDRLGSKEEKKKEEEKKQKEEKKEESSEENETGDEEEEDDSGESDEGSSDDEDEDEFKCDQCGDSFDTKRGLASHKVQKH